MQQVKKAVIPAAGLGTRFLPATKAQPKEMLPIVDKPAIQYIVEEAVASGITDILIVTGRNKRAIEDHFDRSHELEHNLESKGKLSLLEEVRAISEMVDIHYIRQKEALGLGHAVWCARKFIGNEPFAVLLGDDIIVSARSALRQLMDVFEQYNSSVIGVQPVEPQETSKYGVIDPLALGGTSRVMQVKSLVEKPQPQEAPSRLAVMGRYILRPEILDILENLPAGRGGEIQLTDALNLLAKSQAVFSCEFDGVRYDIGDKWGFLQATLDFALERPDLKEQLLRYMEEKLALEARADRVVK